MNSYARNLSQLIFLLKIALAPFPDNLWRKGTDDDQCTNNGMVGSPFVSR